MADNEIRIPADVAVKALENELEAVKAAFSFLEKLTAVAAELLKPLVEEELENRKVQLALLKLEEEGKLRAEARSSSEQE